MKVTISEEELLALSSEEIKRRIKQLATHELAGMPDYCIEILLAQEELDRRNKATIELEVIEKPKGEKL